eukprot:8071700-Pyramimonas_sp.AAC.1
MLVPGRASGWVSETSCIFLSGTRKLPERQLGQSKIACGNTQRTSTGIAAGPDLPGQNRQPYNSHDKKKTQFQDQEQGCERA